MVELWGGGGPSKSRQPVWWSMQALGSGTLIFQARNGCFGHFSKKKNIPLFPRAPSPPPFFVPPNKEGTNKNQSSTGHLQGWNVVVTSPDYPLAREAPGLCLNVSDEWLRHREKSQGKWWCVFTKTPKQIGSGDIPTAQNPCGPPDHPGALQNFRRTLAEPYLRAAPRLSGQTSPTCREADAWFSYCLFFGPAAPSGPGRAQLQALVGARLHRWRPIAPSSLGQAPYTKLASPSYKAASCAKVAVSYGGWSWCGSACIIRPCRRPRAMIGFRLHRRA